MKFFTVLASLALTGFAAAQDQQSKPFNLVVQSSNTTLNGEKLVACHTGAAIESLCVYGNEGSNFFFNTTKGSEAPIDGYSPAGVLVWNLPSQPTPQSEPMSFYIDPSTNVALPLFQPSYDSQYVAFDKKDKMTILTYLDDTQVPPKTTNTTALNNWYVCQTNYLGYKYQTLSWALGNSKAQPQNPSCVKVDVQRKFV